MCILIVQLHKSKTRVVCFFFVFRTQADVSFSATVHNYTENKDRQSQRNVGLYMKASQKKLKELRRLDCPWTSFRDVMTMP